MHIERHIACHRPGSGTAGHTDKMLSDRCEGESDMHVSDKETTDNNVKLVSATGKLAGNCMRLLPYQEAVLHLLCKVHFKH